MTKGGISIIGIIFLGIILIFVLSYFDISIKSLVESPQAQDNIHYVGGVVSHVWNDYLKKPATYFWNFLLDSIKKMRSVEPMDFEKLAPQVPGSN